MGEPDIDQPLSPVVSVGMVTYISTPSSSISDMNMDSESEKRAQTPMKCMGHLYYGQQHKTPCMSSPSWLGLTQSSPSIKTPGSSASGNRMKSLANHHTPSSKHSSKKSTPHMHTPDQPYNPFDSNLLEQLEGSLFSPNVFAEVKSAQQTPRSFQWTVDELAILKPADIDELPNQPNAIPPQADSDLEKRAQEVIDAYFANNLIAPSPWSLNGPKKNFVLPETPKTPALSNSVDSPLTFGDSKTPAGDKKALSSQCDAACQTALTLPVNFDIEKVLGEYVTYKTERMSDDQDILSMSSLRRKLFFHGEDSSLPSPVKSSESTEGKSMECNPSLVSSIKEVHQTPKHSRFTLTESPSPSSSHFSSSPISLSHSNALTPFLRHCSTAGNLIESPGFSPIISRSSPNSHVVTPTCHPLQATPVMRSLESPGMSPIVEPNDSFPAEPTRKLRMSRLRLRPEKLMTPDELRPSVEKANENESSFLDMDVERTSSPQHSVDDLSFVSSQEDRFMKPNNFSLSNVQYSDDELSNQDTMQTYYISQDTGYNTNSLQLTNNQVTGMHSGMTVQSDTSLHTNLTHQFFSLPFSSEGHQSVDGSTMSFTKPETKKAFVRHLAQKSVNNNHENCPHHGDSDMLNEREVRRKAKRILGKSISMDDSQLGTSLDISKQRPYLLNAIGVPAFIMSSPKSSYRKQYMNGEKILPSELASQMLHKAGEDFRKYCDEHLNDNYDGMKEAETEIIHVPMDSESHQNICISTSAEF